MKLTDVARASLAELANDYLNWLLMQERVPWSMRSEEFRRVNSIQLDRPEYKDDVQHLSSLHILRQKHKFDAWLGSDNSLVAANCLLVLCNRLILMLRRQIEHLLGTFKEDGGFTEGLTAERLHIDQKWKFFEQLWQRKNMRNDYNTALEQRKSLDFQDRLKEILG